MPQQQKKWGYFKFEKKKITVERRDDYFGSNPPYREACMETESHPTLAWLSIWQEVSNWRSSKKTGDLQSQPEFTTCLRISSRAGPRKNYTSNRSESSLKAVSDLISRAMWQHVPGDHSTRVTKHPHATIVCNGQRKISNSHIMLHRLTSRSKPDDRIAFKYLVLTFTVNFQLQYYCQHWVKTSSIFDRHLKPSALITIVLRSCNILTSHGTTDVSCHACRKQLMSDTPVTYAW